jgi:hypothetical protein
METSLVDWAVATHTVASRLTDTYSRSNQNMCKVDVCIHLEAEVHRPRAAMGQT